MRKILKFFATTITILILLLVGTVLTIRTIARKHFSESPMPVQIAPPMVFSTGISPLSVDLDNLQEIATFDSSSGSPPVAITDIAKSDNILVIYEDGNLDRWSINSGNVIANHPLFVVTVKQNSDSRQYPIYQMSRNISFSKDGFFAMTPNEVSQDGMIGFNVWNTSTLTQLICSGKEEYCSDIESTSAYTSLALHPTKDQYFSAFSGNVSGWTGLMSAEGNGGYFSVRSGDFEDTTISRLAVDPLGDYLAMSDNLGNVRISDINIYENNAPNLQVLGFPGDANYALLNHAMESATTIDLRFDETHSWLAWLTNENLVVWSLKNYLFPLHFQTELQVGNAMSFDRTGRILAVATQKGISIFDVENKTIIQEYPVGEVTALYFSRDNRILIWGDVEGSIHLWGKKK